MAPQRLAVLTIVFSLPLFVTAYFKPVPDTLRETFFSIVKPVLRAGETVRQSCTDAVTGVRRFFFIYQENNQLKREIELLEREVILLREKEKENDRLRSLLDFKTKTPARTVASQIIARETGHLGNWIVLDKGGRQRLKKDMPVVSEKGLVGKVAEVGPETARVILLTDVESRVGGMVQSSRQTGLVMGDGSPFLRMKFLDPDSDVKVGDEVLSSGLGSVYPKGIPIGTIEFVEREKNGLFLYAKIKPSVSFSRIEEVLCLEYQRVG
ncbi:MAG: rod shape-determining protein MreC [Candidatus Omnitrophica bacterium]|nr:rod shape-determining protein MreC [Candidatus Omnitrophota bacterium]